MALRSKLPASGAARALLLQCLVSCAAALTVHADAPMHAAAAATPTAATFALAAAPFAVATAAVEDDSAAAAASPAGKFDSFGGFSGPKAFASNLEGLADFGDLDGQFDSSGFEQAFTSPNRRADSGSFSEYSDPAGALRSGAAGSFQHYNPQAASGFTAALAAAPAYGARAAPARLPAAGPVAVASPGAYAGALYRPAAAATPAYRAAVPASGTLPLHRPGYVVPLYPPASSAAVAYSPRAAAPAPAAYSPRAAPVAHTPYRPSAAAVPAAVRYSALHANSQRPGLSGGLNHGLPHGPSSSGSSRAVSSNHQTAPARQESFGGDFGGFGFGGGLSDNRASSGGFDFGSEEF